MNKNTANNNNFLFLSAAVLCAFVLSFSQQLHPTVFIVIFTSTLALMCFAKMPRLNITQRMITSLMLALSFLIQFAFTNSSNINLPRTAVLVPENELIPLFQGIFNLLYIPLQNLASPLILLVSSAMLSWGIVLLGFLALERVFGFATAILALTMASLVIMPLLPAFLSVETLCLLLVTAMGIYSCLYQFHKKTKFFVVISSVLAFLLISYNYYFAPLAAAALIFAYFKNRHHELSRGLTSTVE